jgi:hypothetical protein
MTRMTYVSLLLLILCHFTSAQTETSQPAAQLTTR